MFNIKKNSKKQKTPKFKVEILAIFFIGVFAKLFYNNRFFRSDLTEPTYLGTEFYQSVARLGWPTCPVYDPNGNLFSRYGIQLSKGGINRTETDNLYQQIQAVFEPIVNWKTYAEFNYSIVTAQNHWDKQVTYRYDIDNNPYPWTRDSGVQEKSNSNNYMNFNLYTNYTTTLNQIHNFTGMVGMQSAEKKQKGFGLLRDGILVPGIDVVNGTSGLDYDGSPVPPSVNGDKATWTTMGYFGRINYDYKGLYLFEANLRVDGTSRFRHGNRWVASPSFSAGWNIAQEKFWEKLEKSVNMLKLRASYGQLANQNTSNWYPTYSAMGVGNANGAWIVNGKRPNTASAPGNLVNQNPTWEKIRTTNIGIDFALFKARLTGNFDYFIRETKDMIGPAPTMPNILGVGVPKANNTDLEDKGFELQIGWRDILKNGLGYGVRFTLADYQTKIKKYPNPTMSINTHTAGKYMGQIWGFETLGIAKTQEEMDAHLATLPNGGQNQLGSLWGAGDIMYKDINGDGVISKGAQTYGDHGSLKVIGNNTPRYQFGTEFTADYKGFDFRAFLQGVMKRDYWQGSLQFWGITTLWQSTGFTTHDNYFRDENSYSVVNGAKGVNLNSYYPRPVFDSTKNQQTQSRYLQNAAYMRLKNLQLGYTLPYNLTAKMNVTSLRLFMSGDNLLTITKMSKIFDPETIGGGSGGSAYPLSRTLSFGLNINF